MNSRHDALLEAWHSRCKRVVIQRVPSKTAVRGIIMGLEMVLGEPVHARAIVRSDKTYDLCFDLADELHPTEALDWNDYSRAISLQIDKENPP